VGVDGRGVASAGVGVAALVAVWVGAGRLGAAAAVGEDRAKSTFSGG